MFRLEVIAEEEFNEETNEFSSSSKFDLEMEHSLVSLSKWESKWQLSFLSTDTKTDEQVKDYIRMMFSGDVFPEQAFDYMTELHYQRIAEYINAKMTATWFNEPKQPKSSEIVTSELIYYWMIALGIPFSCENWHLNRLLTLIKVCNIKNTPKDKEGSIPRESMADRRARNEARKKALGTTG